MGLGWVHYEFGDALPGIKGDCGLCREHHSSQRQVYLKSKKAKLNWGGKKVPPAHPPCASCPKYKLCPGPMWNGGFGLHPGNRLSVEMYRHARQQGGIRVGTMAGAFLLGTMTNESALAVLTIYDHLFRDELEKQITYEKMKLIDRVATAVLSKAENLERERQAASKPTSSTPAPSRAIKRTKR